MKRQIMKSLMALCAGVMTLCAASSLFVSCELFDDPILKGEDPTLTDQMNDLNDKLNDIDARLKAIEDIKAKLEALTARVDALYTLKFQVSDSNKLQYSFDGGNTWTETGVVLAKEREITFQKSDSNELQYSYDGGETWNGTGFALPENREIVFQVSGNNEFQYSYDGGKTWKDTGIILAKNCDLTFRVNDDNKVLYSVDGGENWLDSGITLPKESEGQVEAKELAFQVSENREIQVSYDNGETWKNTGVKLPEECDCEPVVPVDPCACPEITLVDNGGSVTITIGDQSFTIEKPEEIAFEIRAGKLYFASETTQTVAIKSSGIEDITVMSYPRGWYAEINADGLLSVTAPNYEETVPTFDDDWNEIPASKSARGYVKVHACSSEGKCMVGKLSVEVAEQQLVVKAIGGNYEIASTNEWSAVYYGISPKATYKEDAKVIVDAFANMDWDVIDSWENIAAPSATGLIADVLGYEPKVGEDYVVWAIDDRSESYTIDDLVLAFYSPIFVDVKEDETKRTAYDIYVSVEVLGADSYYALAVPDQGDFGWGGVDYFKEEMVASLDYNGMGKLYKESYTGSLYQITAGTQAYVGSGSPDQKGTLLILPLDGRPNDQYTVEDVLEFEFRTNPLLAGGAVGASAEQIFSQNDWMGEEVALDPYTEIGVQVTPDGEDWTSFYFAWMPVDDYNLYGGDEELIVDYVLKNPASYAIGKTEFTGTVVNSTLSPNTSIYFISFFVDNSDKYGKLVMNKYTTDELIKADIVLDYATDDLVNGLLANKTTLTLNLAPDVTVSKYRYIWTATSYYNQYEGKTDAEMADEIHFATYGYQEVEGTNVITIEEHEYNTPYYLAILPYDEFGSPATSALILEYDCVFQLDNVVSDPAQFDAEPTITFSIPEKKDGGYGEAYYWKDGTTYQFSLAYTITPAAGTEVAAVIINPTGAADYGYDHTISDLDKASGLWSRGLAGQSYYIQQVTANTVVEPRALYVYEGRPEMYILVSWKYKDTYYYKEISLAAELDFMYTDLDWDGTPVTATNTIDGKQWLFKHSEMGNMVFDLGITMPGAMVLAYDVVAMGAPEGTPYQTYNMVAYHVEPMSETCGYLSLDTVDEDGVVIESSLIPYYGLTAETCTFGDNFMLEESVNATAGTVEIAAGGVGGLN